MNQMLNKTQCPACLKRNMIGFRQGDHNPNPYSVTRKVRVCLDCYMDDLYSKFGVEG